MKLNKKISLITISVVFISLLVSSVANIVNFRKNYTDAFLAGSYGLGYTLNNMISELLDLGLPLASLDGMDKKLKQLVQQNPHINYVGVVDLTGTTLFHSDEKLIGQHFTDVFMRNSIATTEPMVQLYQRFDGHTYYDVTIPIFDSASSHIAALRLGFRSEMIEAKVMEAVIHVIVNFSLSFLLIAFGLNQLLYRFVSLPVRALSLHAKRMAAGHYDESVPYRKRNDEIGILSDAFDKLSDTIKSQITALQGANDELEAQVVERTEELAYANAELQYKNDRLEDTVSRLQRSEKALRESEVKFRSLFESSSDAVMLLDSKRFIDCNAAALKIFHCPDRETFCRMHPGDLSPRNQPNGSDSMQLAKAFITTAIAKGGHLFEWVHRRLDTHEDFTAEVLLSPMSLDGKTIVQAVVRDISERKQAEQRERQHRNVMERLVRGEPLETILDSIARSIEQQSPGALCGILLLDDSGRRLKIAAAPGLSMFYAETLDSIVLGEDERDYDTLTDLQKSTVIDDIREYTGNSFFKTLSTQTDLAACWAEPIFGAHKKLLGVFTLCHRESKTPTEGHIELMQYASRLAAITIERSRTEAEQQLAASVFANSYEGIMITDTDNRIVDVNPAFSRITGFSKQEVLGQSPKLLKSGRHDAGMYERMWQSLHHEGYWRGEIWNRRKTGELFAEMLAIATVRDEAGQIRNYVAVFSDISRIKAHEEELDRIAYYDPLTELPNRRLLSDRLTQALAHAQRHHKLLAVCYLDLDGFKPVNDNYGHDAGDQLLMEVSNRLKTTLRSGDTLARLGGDEFVLLMGDFETPQECMFVLERALLAIATPMTVHGHSVVVSASIGVALYPLDDVDGDTLLRHADHAMYRAKQSGKNCYHLFDPKHDQEIKERQDCLQRLVDALNGNEFVLYYQPKVDLLNGKLIGAEALIRWQHPEQGLLAPNAFLDKFDDSTKEIDLGEWVIEAALKQIEVWQNQGLDLIVSINISANHLLHANFTARLEQLLAKYPQVSPGYLELEVLETAALNDIDQAIEVMKQCKVLGVHFALDDFGTGYSSLAYFRRLPVDILKIDQCFVRDMLVDSEDLTIVESVVRLAQAFNRPVIAEGVETLAHASRLIQLGCTFGQGYGIARPMPADKLDNWLAAWLKEAAWQQFETNNFSIDDLPLLAAAQSHRLWVNQLLAYLDRPDEIQVPLLSSADCAFGYWCRGSGHRDYGAWPELKGIIILHERIHQFATELVTLSKTDQRATVVDLQSELCALRDQLLLMIENLTFKVAAQRSAGSLNSGDLVR